MVAPGFFVIHDAVRPPLTDGDYQLQVSQALSADQSAVDPVTRSFRLVGPRYALPPDQVLSLFPPRDGTGAFADRLPQIVLRRRTLPFERAMQPDDPPPAPPWLALVVLADGEGQLLTNQPLDASLPEQDDKDAPVRDVLRVSERVVQAVFPTIEDLPWLTHVREVDVSDTELALGDDADGWMAVVIATGCPCPALGGDLQGRDRSTAVPLHRLPGQPRRARGRSADRRVASSSPQFVFSTSHVYSDLEITTVVETAPGTCSWRRCTQDPGWPPGWSGAERPPARTPPPEAGAQQARQAASGSEKPRRPGRSRRAGGGRRPRPVDPGQPDGPERSPAPSRPSVRRLVPVSPVAAPQSVAARPASTAAVPTFVVNGLTNAGALKGLTIDPIFYDRGARIVKFTVLTSWSFTSQPEGDFAWLMKPPRRGDARHPTTRGPGSRIPPRSPS